MRTSYAHAPKLIGISSGTEEDVVESQVLRNNAGSAVWGQNCRQVALHPGGHDGLVLRTVAINLESRLDGIELCGHCECKSESKLATFSNFDATVAASTLSKLDRIQWLEIDSFCDDVLICYDIWARL